MAPLRDTPVFGPFGLKKEKKENDRSCSHMSCASGEKICLVPFLISLTRVLSSCGGFCLVSAVARLWMASSWLTSQTRNSKGRRQVERAKTRERGYYKWEMVVCSVKKGDMSDTLKMTCVHPSFWDLARQQ